ncbi:carbohydrate-binding and sugar hydrolysis [Striga asiatica]|uniref:Carbohydrate-binding and sugar hydrolysis n=1 Tax=Striga asiatica TaxID=4170 RepID=A0A5A7QTU5_STRAF|nr:carbohydrate-binding and sugar hydrolysis [Striga asiatica]
MPLSVGTNCTPIPKSCDTDGIVISSNTGGLSELDFSSSFFSLSLVKAPNALSIGPFNVFTIGILVRIVQGNLTTTFNGFETSILLIQSNAGPAFKEDRKFHITSIILLTWPGSENESVFEKFPSSQISIISSGRPASNSGTIIDRYKKSSKCAHSLTSIFRVPSVLNGKISFPSPINMSRSN